MALSLVEELKKGMLQNLTEAMEDPEAADAAEEERQSGFHPIDLDEVKKNSFPDHKGRPGQRGGSLPRDSQGQTDTPEFKQWFGDSKIVDDKGKPLVVYHGTMADFESFRSDKRAWFTTDSHVGDLYATEDPNDTGIVREGSKVLPLYVSMQNPYYVENTEAALNRWANIRDDDLAARGYDGVILLGGSIMKAKGGKRGSGHYTGYPFNVQQIKSKFNKGSFDPNDPRISFSFPGHKGRPGQRGGSLPRGESDQEVDELEEKAVKSGGFTYNPVRWKDREPPKQGFALSIRKDTEKVVDLSAKRDDLRRQLKQYIHEHRADIKAQGNFLGGWIDNGKLYIDISKVVGDKQKAIELAQKADQLAIYDLGKGETIDVKKAA